MATDFSDKKTMLSEFNEAIYQLQRLHGIWQECNLHAKNGRLKEWKWALDRAWVELAADAIEKNKKKFQEELANYNLTIANANDNPSMYKALMDKEIWLRCLQESVGKGGKKSQVYENIM